MPKQPTFIIPQFTGSTAQDFRSHKLQLDTTFHTLDILEIFLKVLNDSQHVDLGIDRKV